VVDLLYNSGRLIVVIVVPSFY